MNPATEKEPAVTFARVRVKRKKYILACYVRLSAYLTSYKKNSAPTVQGVVKFDIWDFKQNLSRKSKFG
jgi:hypothetical protein